MQKINIMNNISIENLSTIAYVLMTRTHEYMQYILILSLKIMLGRIKITKYFLFNKSYLVTTIFIFAANFKQSDVEKNINS